MIPDPWEAILLSVAIWRSFHLLAYDDILDTPRRYVTGRLSEKWEDFVTCVYCAGFWISVLWYVSWLLFGEWAIFAAVPYALNSGAIAMQKYVASDD